MSSVVRQATREDSHYVLRFRLIGTHSAAARDSWEVRTLGNILGRSEEGPSTGQRLF